MADKNSHLYVLYQVDIYCILMYNKILNAEINKLLSEPHNNYKLEINRKKYENQVALLEKLVDIINILMSDVTLILVVTVF